jgi:anti-anti-sigma factor
MSFEAAVRQEGRVAVVDLRGEIFGPADEALQAAYAEATSTSPEAVLLNFEDVSYINSSGIALIVGLLAKARGTGTELRAYGLTEHYREIFQITRLADLIGIYPDEQSAVVATAAT